MFIKRRRVCVVVAILRYRADLFATLDFRVQPTACMQSVTTTVAGITYMQWGLGGARARGSAGGRWGL